MHCLMLCGEASELARRRIMPMERTYRPVKLKAAYCGVRMQVRIGVTTGNARATFVYGMSD